MKIIGLTGRAGAGKDTAYVFIKHWAMGAGGWIAAREAFADRLKISAAHSLGVFQDEVEFCDTLKREGSNVYVSSVSGASHRFSGREFLQWYGTEAHRDVFGTDFWVDALFQQKHNPSFPDILVITDCRFPNEAEAIRRRGGEIWEIRRPLEGNDGAEHASTQPLDPDLISVVINNDRSEDDFRDVVRAICDGRILSSPS